MNGAAEESAVRGIGEVADVHHPHQDADDGDHLGEEGSELVELLLQRGHLVILRLVHRVANLPDGGIHSGADHHRARVRR